MKSLKELTVRGDRNGSPIDDSGMVHLKFLLSLKNLSLERIPISDNAVEHLKHLTSLDEVRIAETRISQAAAKKLKEELPPFSNVNRLRAMVNCATPAYLTKKQAAKLATTIANNEFERLYNKRPFTPPKYSKEQENSRWDGGQVILTGKDGAHAEVWLNKKGRDQKVRVYLNQSDSNL